MDCIISYLKMNDRTIHGLQNLFSKIIDKAVNIIIPKEKGVKFLENLGPGGLFENIPRSENFDFETDKIKAIFCYKNTLCRQAIWEIKYRANKKLIRDFSLLLYEYILEELGDLETFGGFSRPVLIPIPASKTRQKEKGFNQCVLIIRELIKIDKERNGNNFTSLENFLIKKIDTPHQARVSNRKNRLKNLINTFSVNESGWLATRNNSLRLTRTNHSESFLSSWPDFGKLSERLGTPLIGESYSEIGPMKTSKHSFIIIDDVITTGATMNEAFRALKEAGINTKKIRGFALAH
jgi:predicted amidophosphoribosyltransferase